MEPHESALNAPVVFSKMRRTLYATSGNSRNNIPQHTRLPAKWIIICFICMQFLWTTRRSALQCIHEEAKSQAYMLTFCSHSYWHRVVLVEYSNKFYAKHRYVSIVETNYGARQGHWAAIWTHSKHADFHPWHWKNLLRQYHRLNWKHLSSWNSSLVVKFTFLVWTQH